MGMQRIEDFLPWARRSERRMLRLLQLWEESARWALGPEVNLFEGPLRHMDALDALEAL